MEIDSGKFSGISGIRVFTAPSAIESLVSNNFKNGEVPLVWRETFFEQYNSIVRG